MKIYRVIQSFFHRYFSDEEAVILVLLILGFFACIYFFGKVLTPVLAAVIFSYLLSPLVDRLSALKIPHTIAVLIVFVVFFGLALIGILTLLPELIRQISGLVTDIPSIIKTFQDQIVSLPAKYPELFSVELVTQWGDSLALDQVSQQISAWLPNVVTFSLSTLPAVITVLIYVIVVPLMVFFILKDKSELWGDVQSALPTQRRLMNQIAIEMNQQIENYIRGKVIEIFIVGGISFIVFTVFGLKYAGLLGVIVGFSVLIPYIGATVATLPVFAIGLFQWGFGADLYWLLLAYLVIQILDGNVLVPILFSEAVNLHPISIIVAVLIFGGIWGFWGIFFAIPLATFVKAIINAWPRSSEQVPD